MPLSFKDVSEILKVIDASGIEELSIEVDGMKLHVRRHGAGEPPAASAAPAPQPAAEPRAASDTAPAPAEGTAPAADAPPEDGAIAVPSPMVGTFYRKPSPDEPAFVEEGQTVAEGDPLCLLEVMKLFTQVEAPCAGTVIALPVTDGEGVEYGQTLFWIRPS